MIIVPWATIEPTRTLVASALPHAPVINDATAGVVKTLWRRLVTGR